MFAARNFFHTLIPPARAPRISTLLRCQVTHFEKSRTPSTLIPKMSAFPSIRALLRGAFERDYQAVRRVAAG